MLTTLYLFSFIKILQCCYFEVTPIVRLIKSNFNIDYYKNSLKPSPGLKKLFVSVEEKTLFSTNSDTFQEAFNTLVNEYFSRNERTYVVAVFSKNNALDDNETVELLDITEIIKNLDFFIHYSLEKELSVDYPYHTVLYRCFDKKSSDKIFQEIHIIYEKLKNNDIRYDIENAQIHKTRNMCNSVFILDMNYQTYLNSLISLHPFIYTIPKIHNSIWCVFYIGESKENHLFLNHNDLNLAKMAGFSKDLHTYETITGSNSFSVTIKHKIWRLQSDQTFYYNDSGASIHFEYKESSVALVSFFSIFLKDYFDLKCRLQHAHTDTEIDVLSFRLDIHYCFTDSPVIVDFLLKAKYYVDVSGQKICRITVFNNLDGNSYIPKTSIDFIMNKNELKFFEEDLFANEQSKENYLQFKEALKKLKEYTDLKDVGFVSSRIHRVSYEKKLPISVFLDSEIQDITGLDYMLPSKIIKDRIDHLMEGVPCTNMRFYKLTKKCDSDDAYPDLAHDIFDKYPSILHFKDFILSEFKSSINDVVEINLDAVEMNLDVVDRYSSENLYFCAAIKLNENKSILLGYARKSVRYAFFDKFKVESRHNVYRNLVDYMEKPEISRHYNTDLLLKALWNKIDPIFDFILETVYMNEPKNVSQQIWDYLESQDLPGVLSQHQFIEKISSENNQLNIDEQNRSGINERLFLEENSLNNDSEILFQGNQSNINKGKAFEVNLSNIDKETSIHFRMINVVDLQNSILKSIFQEIYNNIMQVQIFQGLFVSGQSSKMEDINKMLENQYRFLR